VSEMNEIVLTDYKNAYSNPADLGLEIVGEASDSEASYSFDIFIVFRDHAGVLYYAEDSGCSCPSPFEDYVRLSDLTRATIAEIHAALDEWAREDRPYRKCRESATELHGILAGLS
jgi:hypothetical protein